MNRNNLPNIGSENNPVAIPARGMQAFRAAGWWWLKNTAITSGPYTGWLRSTDPTTLKDLDTEYSLFVTDKPCHCDDCETPHCSLCGGHMPFFDYKAPKICDRCISLANDPDVVLPLQDIGRLCNAGRNS